MRNCWPKKSTSSRPTYGLLNTGWSGGAYGTGKRMSLSVTRAIIDAIHSGQLAEQTFVRDPIFGLDVPQACPNVDAKILQPRATWASATQYDATAQKFVSSLPPELQEV